MRHSDPIARIDLTTVKLPARATRQRGEETRRRLILEAADLFAERGIDGVGIQEILDRAGQRNASAIQYHFGSKPGLVIAVLQPRPDVRGPIDDERMRLLTLLTAGSQAVTLRGAVEVLVLPSLAYLHSHAGRSLVRVAAQVMRTLPLDARVDPTMPADRQATALLSTLLPSHLPEHLRRERLGVARTLFIELIANRAREIEHGLAPHLNEDEFAREMVAVTTGLLAAD